MDDELIFHWYDYFLLAFLALCIVCWVWIYLEPLLDALFPGLLRKERTASGKESMVGRPVEARTALSPRGRVNYQGRIWNAEMLEGTADKGEELSIAEVKGLRLIVRRSGD